MPTLVDKQVASLLKAIKAVAGVPQVIVCDNQGKVLGVLSDSNLDSADAKRIGLFAAQSLGAVQRISGKPHETEIQYERGTLLIRQVGNAFVIVSIAPNVNWSLLRMTVNIAAADFEKDRNLQKALAEIVPLSDALGVMSAFANALIEEFGDHGIGRDRMTQLLGPSVTKLKGKYSFFQPVSVVDGRIDLSPLERELAAPEEIVKAWSDLISDLCDIAIEGLGEQASIPRYRKAGGAVFKKNKKIFQSMDLESVIPVLDMPIGF